MSETKVTPLPRPKLGSGTQLSFQAFSLAPLSARSLGKGWFWVVLSR